MLSPLVQEKKNVRAIPPTACCEASLSASPAGPFRTPSRVVGSPYSLPLATSTKMHAPGRLLRFSRVLAPRGVCFDGGVYSVPYGYTLLSRLRKKGSVNTYLVKHTVRIKQNFVQNKFLYTVLPPQHNSHLLCVLNIVETSEEKKRQRAGFLEKPCRAAEIHDYIREYMHVCDFVLDLSYPFH